MPLEPGLLTNAPDDILAATFYKTGVVALAKILPGATNPLTGGKMDLSLRGIVGLLLGGLVIWGVVATTQNVGKTITDKAHNKYIDFTPDPITQKETVVHDNTVYMG